MFVFMMGMSFSIALLCNLPILLVIMIAITYFIRKIITEKRFTFYNLSNLQMKMKGTKYTKQCISVSN